jgi:hypothetical protein
MGRREKYSQDAALCWRILWQAQSLLSCSLFVSLFRLSFPELSRPSQKYRENRSMLLLCVNSLLSSGLDSQWGGSMPFVGSCCV